MGGRRERPGNGIEEEREREREVRGERDRVGGECDSHVGAKPLSVVLGWGG